MEYTQFLEGIVHEPFQRRDRGFDLTVAAVYAIDGPGRVVFGGGKLDPADTAPHDSRNRYPEDDYEWGHLAAVQYLLKFNESLVTDGRVFTCQARQELLDCGRSIPRYRYPNRPEFPSALEGRVSG